jgi:hypothetical protein
MNFERFLSGVVIGCVILMATMPTQAQQVEPGVGLRGLLEVGRLYRPQIRTFNKRYNATPESYDIEVEHSEGIITAIKFNNPRFSTRIKGVRVHVNQAWSREDTDRIGGLKDPELGVELIEKDNKIEAIEVYPPLR